MGMVAAEEAMTVELEALDHVGLVVSVTTAIASSRANRTTVRRSAGATGRPR